ncbi:hypothetical protein [Sphingomonas lenta]|uniref:Uncharacterized protein n=1 Tax=Sphingomonas lenta TaxID=1141887 RepID=A0A2A2SJP5_9SPHN|nr:hypothetical protein [Sphingomonas lenta]PAX09251.1 hypothetical protein CKY28_00325 [Sphingomonas lenta]
MVEPSRRTSRLALAGGVAASLGLLAAGFLLGRAAAPEPAPVATPAPLPVPTPTPSPTPVVRTALDRAALLEAARLAADAFASGGPAPAQVAELAGRRFELSMAFGCAGPSAVLNAPLGWRYDEAAETLRVRAQPVLWEPSAWVPLRSVEQVETVEGFWIPRPWTVSDACPSNPTLGAGGAPDEQTLAVAQFHTVGGSRLGRSRGEAFEATERVAPDALSLAQGLRLRLTGRVTPAPGDGPIVCRAVGGPERRPTCLVSVSFAEVAIENPTTGATLATWDVSRSGTPGG